MPHRQGDVFLVVLPRKEAHLGVGRKVHHFHRRRVRVRGSIVRQHQQRCLTGAHEVACHREHEVNTLVHPVKVALHHFHGELRLAGNEVRRPDFQIVLDEEVREIGIDAAGLRVH